MRYTPQRLYALFPVGWAILGCSPDQPEISSKPILPLTVRESTKERHHDFGPLLSSGQTLEHRFILKNQDMRPLRILGSQAMTPCCSEIGLLPRTIAAGGRCEVRVTFRPGYDAGKRRVEFVVATDRGDVTFSVVASMMPAFEVEFDDEAGDEVAAGREATRVLVVTCRRIGEEGLPAPSAVTIDPPSSVRLEGPPAEISREGGVTETRNRVVVTHPATQEPGPKSTELRVVWEAKGREERQSILWTVRPALKISPPAIILERGSRQVITRNILVESTGAEFRVLKVVGKAIAHNLALPESRSVTHRLAIPIDPRAIGISDIMIQTDHPEQPIVKASLMVKESTATTTVEETP